MHHAARLCLWACLPLSIMTAVADVNPVLQARQSQGADTPHVHGCFKKHCSLAPEAGGVTLPQLCVHSPDFVAQTFGLANTTLCGSVTTVGGLPYP